MGTAQTALCPVAAMETPANPGQTDDAAGADSGQSMAIRLQRLWSLAECRGDPHGRCVPRVLLRRSRTGVTAGGASTPQSPVMNRRVGNPMHAGVGGRREQSRLLPD
jgi:hypothetical protein